MNDLRDQPADTLIDSERPQSSAAILDALRFAERSMRDYNEIARRIDNIYSARSQLGASQLDLGLSDQEYDTFWSSMEVLKPAIYAKAPQVVAKPRYSDANATDKVVAELIERVVNSEFDRNGIDMHLREVRDDMALLNRGVLRVSYEDDGSKRVCVDHVDRLDFRHEPVRYWPELGWEAFCAWMTEKQMADRFGKTKSRDAYKRAAFVTRESRDDGAPTDSAKAPVWEVWSKTDDRVYWVTEGVDVILDEDAPHLELRDFFPGPRPAFGTLRRRSLIPVPDYIRYERHLNQINDLTNRIYTLLDRVRVVGLIPAGGDVGTAIETAMSENTTAMFIPVPGAAMGNGGDYVQWLPIDVIANTITGLIQARQQLFADFDRLSGISDIMRGETEAEETLGAQRLKGQYGSVRVKDKTEEIVRLARDTARVAVEIICDKFDKETLLKISQMSIPSKKDVAHDIEEIKKAAKAELQGLEKQAKEAIDQAKQQGHQIDPGQAQQQLQQAQQQIGEKYAPQLQALNNTVVIEDVMSVIKDRRERALVIDIETDSTVMVDELAEKQAANELLQAFSGSVGALMPLFSIGEAGVKLAVSMLKFALQPYVRGNREIQAQLDELIDQAPEIAQKMQDQASAGPNEEMAKAQQTLAEAEKTKADAAMAAVQSRSQADQAANQLKMADMQQKAQSEQQKLQAQMAAMQQKAQADAGKLQHDNDKLHVSVAQLQTEAQQSADKLAAEIDNLRAQTYQILVNAGIAQDQAALDQFKTVEDVHAKRTDQAMGAVNSLKQNERDDRAATLNEHTTLNPPAQENE